MINTHNWSLTGKIENKPVAASAVVVIGAGMAGLAAARILHDSGLNVTVIEARNRIGGRIWTNGQLGADVDLGASWIHGADHNPLTQWCERLGIELKITPNDGRHFGIAGGFVAWEELVLQCTQGLTALERAGANRAGQMTIAELVEPLIGDPALPLLDRQVLAWMTGVAEGVQAGLASDLDVQWWQPKELSIVNAMPVGGYRQLVQDVADGVEIHLNSVVEKVTLTDNAVTIQTAAQTYHADQVIITLPVGVLQTGKIEFVPPLPVEKQRAIQQIGYGGGVLNKIFVRFPYRFWHDTQDRHISLPATVEERGIFANWTNLQPLLGQPILMSFSSGANGAFLDHNLPDAQIYAQAMKSLRRIFGESIPEAEDYLVTHWLTDPGSLGSYSYARFGVDDTAARKAYAAPVANRLFFAGEATDPDEFGTVHAALLSGEQAASAIFERVCGQKAEVSHLPYK